MIPTLTVTPRALADIRPYWRNPRNNDTAVEAVKESIREFGLNQPIVIDAKGVIVVGHTRFRALSELGATLIPVVVVDLPPEKVKAYRIADNKTSELATWDTDALIQELREVADSVDMQVFFGDVDLNELMTGVSAVTHGTPTQEQIDKLAGDMGNQFTERSLKAAGSMVRVMCPHCASEFNLDRDEVARQPAVQE